MASANCWPSRSSRFHSTTSSPNASPQLAVPRRRRRNRDAQGFPEGLSASADTGYYVRPRVAKPARPPCENLLARKRLFVGAAKRRFENVADGLPRAAVELNQSQVLDRPKAPRPGTDLDAGQWSFRPIKHLRLVQFDEIGRAHV